MQAAIARGRDSWREQEQEKILRCTRQEMGRSSRVLNPWACSQHEPIKSVVFCLVLSIEEGVRKKSKEPERWGNPGGA